MCVTVSAAVEHGSTPAHSIVTREWASPVQKKGSTLRIKGMHNVRVRVRIRVRVRVRVRWGVHNVTWGVPVRTKHHWLKQAIPSRVVSSKPHCTTSSQPPRHTYNGRVRFTLRVRVRFRVRVRLRVRV